MDSDPNFTVVKQGAEGRIYKGLYLGKPVIVKERFVKKYRHPVLDDSLTKERMKAEVRAICRCKEAGIFTPALYLIDIRRRCIFMEEIEGSISAKEYIIRENENGDSEKNKKNIEKLAYDTGRSISKMHTNNVIHGDLTTSNILVNDDKLYFIDFGLSQFSSSAEDKAVDLYVLERALVSTHANSQYIFDMILQSYQSSSKNCKDIINKLEQVRARGRKRTMIG